MALTVGSRIAHYDVTALIGEGGMGQVYQATDTKLNRQVALKILPEAFGSDPDRRARFKREAEVLASLNHPGIAQIHGTKKRATAAPLFWNWSRNQPWLSESPKARSPWTRRCPLRNRSLRRRRQGLDVLVQACVIGRDHRLEAVVDTAKRGGVFGCGRPTGSGRLQETYAQGANSQT